MNEDNYSKRRFYRFLSWVIVGIYLVFNVGIFISGVPFAVMAVSLPVINIVLITAWFVVRFFFNKANDPIKHSRYFGSKATEPPLPKYGVGNGLVYEPNIKVSTEQFNDISTGPNNKTVFDITMKDYLKLDRVITFHDEIDYGTTKKVRISKVDVHEKDIDVSFSQLDETLAVQ